jgi:hypothetical protein
VPAPKAAGTPHRKPIGVFRPTLGLLGASAVFLASTALALLLPARSESGRVVRAFVDHTAGGDLDSAYELLAERKRQQLSLQQFQATLPSKLRAASGFTVNGQSGGVGAGDGSETCLDGWLDDVDGYSGYRFDLVAEGDEQRIVSWQEGSCPRRQ